MFKMDSAKNEDNVIPSREEPKHISRVNDLTSFRYKRILSENQETKFVVIEGSFDHEPEPAILILEKESFEEEKLKNIFQEDSEVKENFQNDIYYNYKYLPKSAFNGIKTTLVYPATEKHIRKYEHQPVHIIQETPQLYETVTLPFLKSEQFTLQWVFNILEHKSEFDRIIYEDPDSEVGFILLSDLKWDGKTVETLYLLALPFKRGIMSLRDLTQRDLPLLKNIYNKGIKAIEDRYSIPSTQLRVYLHYQPSFYHLHVHFTYLQYSVPGSGTERAHLLSSVINNLELMSNYYQISTLDFTIREGDNLFTKYEALGCCHVCVVLQENLKSKVVMKLKKFSLMLEINGRNLEINFPGFVVDPLTMTNFRSTPKYLSFRVQAECNLQCQLPPPLNLNPPLPGKEKLTILCQCHNPLTSEVTFDRVLPLPSSQFNVSDMFCHLHGNPLPSNSLQPGISDCFYTDDFIVVSSEMVTGSAKKNKFFKCKRCLTAVGVCENNSVKLWRCSLKLPSENLSLLEYFKHLVWKAVSDSFSMFPKILLECEENFSYLSMLVVDKNLIISTSLEDLRLKNKEVIKIKYKFHLSCDSHVRLLKDDPFHSLHHVQVHKPMMDFSAQFLISSSKTIPSIFSRADDECMAYLALSE